MKNIIINLLKGIVIGIGKIIPGVSGAVIAISLGVYEKGLEAITKINKENIKFLINIGSGIVISIILFSKLILYFMNNYYLPTMLLFIGLIIGGTFELKKNIKFDRKIDIVMLLISIILMYLISTLEKNPQNNVILQMNLHTYIKLIFAGILDAFATVFPGISGTALLMLYGCYNTIMMALSNVLQPSLIVSNLFVLTSYGSGMLIGIIMFSKIITYLFKKHSKQTSIFILGISVSTIFMLLKDTIGMSKNIIEELAKLKENPDDISVRRRLRGLVTAAQQVDASAFPSIRKYAYDKKYKLI